MTDAERRALEREELCQQYRDAGFTEPQADLLVSKIIDRRRPWRREIWIVAFLTIAFVVLGWFLVGDYGDRIQENREEVTRDNCEATNERHDNTIKVLDQILAQAVKENPQRADRINQSRDSTVFLINALVPKADCDERVAAIAVDG